MDIQRIKQRFGIIGNYAGLNRSIDIAVQVAATDLSVLITGESGTGKEVFPQIIHQHSLRKHNNYIPVNCGAIPEGTIDSELFGHEKGSFTGAHESRKGYFEVADGGTIFLDEVAELPLSTQVRLLRVLETGEFIRVGSSKVQKTNVRVIAATNMDVVGLIQKGRFREDLFYRLNTIPITVPPLRERGEDIILLFRKFASDFAERYRMPSVRLEDDAKNILLTYQWPGNIRQLKNITEQLSIIEEQRDITAEILEKYLPDYSAIRLPVLLNKKEEEQSFSSEREILYKVLFDLKNDVNELKKLVFEIIQKGTSHADIQGNAAFMRHFDELSKFTHKTQPVHAVSSNEQDKHIQDTEEIVDEKLSLEDIEVEMIKRALDKHRGKRKNAANDLGISERTLYRKIKEYNLE